VGTESDSLCALTTSMAIQTWMAEVYGDRDSVRLAAACRHIHVYMHGAATGVVVTAPV
jgi:hypothetical protein